MYEWALTFIVLFVRLFFREIIATKIISGRFSFTWLMMETYDQRKCINQEKYIKRDQGEVLL